MQREDDYQWYAVGCRVEETDVAHQYALLYCKQRYLFRWRHFCSRRKLPGRTDWYEIQQAVSLSVFFTQERLHNAHMRHVVEPFYI